MARPDAESMNTLHNGVFEDCRFCQDWLRQQAERRAKRDAAKAKKEQK